MCYVSIDKIKFERGISISLEKCYKHERNMLLQMQHLYSPFELKSH